MKYEPLSKPDFSNRVGASIAALIGDANDFVLIVRERTAPGNDHPQTLMLGSAPNEVLADMILGFVSRMASTGAIDTTVIQQLFQFHFGIILGAPTTHASSLQ